MNDEAGIILIIATIICLIIAELFGRSKHIGRWWTFFLLLSGLIPGIIAVIVSPSAKEKPTQGGKSYIIWGWICLVFGVGNTIALISNEGKTGQLFFAFFILAYYLFELSKGHIINKEPKYYFDNLKFNSSTFLSQSNTNLEASENFSSNTDHIKTNLKKLKDSGLLTQSEYLNKLKIIEDEAAQNFVLQTDEYFNLKQLYEAGVLDKVEFDDKVRALKSIFDVDKNNIVNNIKAAPTISTVKKKRKTGLYYLIAGILILMAAFLINWDEAMYELKDFNDSNSIDNQEIVTPSTGTNFQTINSMEPVNPTKFVYVLIKTKEPTFFYLQGMGHYDVNLGFVRDIEDTNTVTWKENTYTTDIKEITDYNEDAKYRFLDETEPIVRMKLAYADSNFSDNVYSKCTDASKKSSLVENHSELIDKNIFVFDSYKEASIHRENASKLPEKSSESTVKYSVNQTRAYFYNEPTNESIKKAFLVYGENFCSSQVENNFVYVIYTNLSGKETKGWIKASDLNRE
ncbi:SHOCT domain-containing protein [Flavobacterium sp. XS2P14]|uniref:SHOCT domain-containing protein n=1 Tax=Flavobacterium sp. XS2P14 TaxID=3401735 RepID=UPI003AAFA7CB